MRTKKTATKKRKRKPTVITFRFTDDPVWSCPLTCATCAYRKRDGNMCKNRVCFGTPLCWSHNKVLYGVKIKESGEKNAGKGLFATKAFEPNEWVCPYSGFETTKPCIDQWYKGADTTAPYVECDYSQAMASDSTRVCVDAACTRGIGSMANTKVTLVRDEATGVKVPVVADRSLQNCDTELRGDGSIWLKTLKKINKDRELFVFYGDQYLLQDNHSTKRRVKQDKPGGPPPCK